MIRRLLCSLVAVAACSSASAAVITFVGDVCSDNADGSGAFVACVNFGYLNQAVGDTPQLDIAYADLINSRTLSWWADGYNNLPAAVWSGNSNAPGGSHARITLTPAAGYAVTLNGFDLGAWLFTHKGTILQADEIGGGFSFSFAGVVGDPVSGMGPPTSFVFGSPSSARGSVIEWKDTAFDVGLANLAFEVQHIGVVPEPQSLALVLGAIAALGGASRRRRTS